MNFLDTIKAFFCNRQQDVSQLQLVIGLARNMLMSNFCAIELLIG